MKLKSAYIREQQRYTQKQLCEIIGYPEEKSLSVIRRLKEFGILKAVRATDFQRDLSDLSDEDVEITEVAIGEDDFLYVFTFVGIIVVAGLVLKCYPKYIRCNTQPKDELVLIMKVLEKYNSKEQIIRLFNDSTEGKTFNLLAVMLFLLQDYFENGPYTTTEDVVETNGSGEILWDKTINETFSMISNNRPYYIDLQTKRRITNDYDYIKRLHECILTRISEELKSADLLDLFSISGVDLSDERLDDFGDNEYILYRIENELNVQFNTRRQLVLKTLYAYINNNGSLYDSECMSLFGTNNFNLVWEDICAEILDNQLQNKLKALSLPVPLKKGYDPEITLLDLIERPQWTVTGKTATDTLIPDLITIFKKAGVFFFMIFDAKYYCAQLEEGKTPKGQPGIESVTKQYLYQLAYQEFITDHKISLVKNCFLMPTDDEAVVDKGEVCMEMLSNLGLQNIAVRLLPVRIAYETYLSGRHLDSDILGL